MNIRSSDLMVISFICGALVIFSSRAEGDDVVRDEYEEVGKRLKTADSNVSSDAAFPSEDSSLDDYIGYSLLHNRELREAFGLWNAAMERARQAGYYDEPVLTFEKALDEVDMDYRVALTQPIPWYGKRVLRKKMGRAESEAAMNNFKAVRSEVYVMVVAAFSEYRYLGRVISVTAENLQLLEDLEQAVQAGYESGKAELSDLTKVQVEIDKLKNDLASLRDARLVRSSRLAALLNLDTEKLLPWPKAQAANEEEIPADALFDLLRELNPELKAMDSVVERDELAMKLAGKSRYPDFTVGVGWMVMPENDDGEQMTDTSLMVGVKLPLWFGKYASERREAEAMRGASVAARDKLEDDLRVELRTAIFKSRDALRRFKLYKESLIPKGQQAYEVAMREYAAGKTGFMALIDAQRTLLDFRVKYERAVADIDIAIAEIGCCVGKYGGPLASIQKGEK